MLSPKEQKDFILAMYQDLFKDTDATKLPDYCASNFIKENNYDISNYDEFVDHVKDLHTKDAHVNFDIEFIINVPGQVLIRTIVKNGTQIDGSPPLSLLMSYWQFNKEGLTDYCKEIESSS